MTHNQPQGYLAVPSAGTGPGVLVLHAWWGLNDFFRDFCDRLSQEGFIAFAPDMYTGKIARTIEEAERLKSGWDEEHEVPPIILPAAENLRDHAGITGHGLAVVGFSMGAFWALWLAQQVPELIRAVVLFYGTDGGSGDFTRSKASYLGHFAEMDPYETESGIRELENNLKGANRPTTFYSYPGTGHWFFETDRQDAFHAQAAQLAWDRTLAFLRSSPISSTM